MAVIKEKAARFTSVDDVEVMLSREIDCRSIRISHGAATVLIDMRDAEKLIEAIEAVK